MLPQTVVEFAVELPFPSKVENDKFLQRNLLKVCKGQWISFYFSYCKANDWQRSSTQFESQVLSPVPFLWLSPLSVPLSWFPRSPMHYLAASARSNTNLHRALPELHLSVFWKAKFKPTLMEQNLSDIFEGGKSPCSQCKTAFACFFHSEAET